MSNPPTTLGKYQIIREIARSNDIVYEAYDPLMNRRVALKELAVPSGSTAQQKEERLKRFLREAKAAGSLAHPNIVTIYEVGEEAGRHYLVMEYLDGHTLRNELDTHGFLAPDRSLEIGEAVLRGLEYAHQNGVIHRDIKPENIQLLTDGRIKLTDFGIARLTFEPNLTMDGQVFGTPSYMSPEQVVGREIDARSDLFGVGVLLYEMMSGQKPFTGDSVVTITYAIMNKEPDQPHQINHALWQVIHRALDKSPALRFANATEMLSSLQAAKQASSQVVLDPQQYAAGQPTLNPYLPAPPPINPYINQQLYQPPAPTPPPPLQYAYNPYQPPSQLPYVPTPAQLPATPYYPPPPRKPLLNPEQRATMNKVIIIFISVALLMVGVVVALQALFGDLPVKGSTPAPAVQPAAAANPSSDSTANPDEQAGNDSLTSEQTAVSAPERANDYQQAAANFENAAESYKLSGNANGERRSLAKAAQARFDLARLLEMGEDRRGARESLYQAEKDAPEGDLRREIEDELNRIS